MPSVEQRVKSILKSAELSFELGIINATRYGPMIHANVPDYAEIMLRVFIEENSLTPRKFFHTLVSEIQNFFLAHRSAADQVSYREVTDYFLQTRDSFRNPLHHTDRVQGYVIEQREALRCLLMLDQLLLALFPSLNASAFEDLNYPCYLKYLQMEYDESLGRGNHRLYQAVAAELRRLQDEDHYDTPHEFNVSRLIAVRRLFRLDDDQFARTVLQFRPVLKQKIFDTLRNNTRGMTPRQMRNALSADPNVSDLSEREIEACLQYIHNEFVLGQGTVVVRGSQYSIAPP